MLDGLAFVDEEFADPSLEQGDGDRAEGDPLPVDAALLTSSMFVGDVIGGHGVTPLRSELVAQWAKAVNLCGAGCKTANGGHMVEAALDVMADFMLRKADSSTGEGRGRLGSCHRHDQDAQDAPV
jgi:hypothetical protein